jgi:transposase
MYYIPPCSPQLNPVQGVFEQVRERLEKRLMNGNITSYRAMWNCL